MARCSQTCLHDYRRPVAGRWLRAAVCGCRSGDIVGSNMINLGVVLGLTGLLAPVAGASVGLMALVTLVGLTLLLWALLMLLPLVHRWTGAMLLALFGVYQFSVVS